MIMDILEPLVHANIMYDRNKSDPFLCLETSRKKRMCEFLFVNFTGRSAFYHILLFGFTYFLTFLKKCSKFFRPSLRSLRISKMAIMDGMTTNETENRYHQHQTFTIFPQKTLNYII